MEREAFILHANGWLPNNERLAVEVYRGVVRAEGEKAAQAFETLFADHDWPPRWRDTIFDYHHYHSTTHEALGVFAGFATLALGGPGGRIIEVQAGDALLPPVGTGIAGSTAATILRSSAPIQSAANGTSAPRRQHRRPSRGCGACRSRSAIR